MVPDARVSGQITAAAALSAALAAAAAAAVRAAAAAAVAASVPAATTACQLSQCEGWAAGTGLLLQGTVGLYIRCLGVVSVFLLATV